MARSTLAYALVALFGAFGCDPASVPDAQNTPSAAAGKADGGGGACLPVAASVRTGDIDDDLARELSGLVVSRRQPGVLWTHNDGGAGDRNTLLAVDARGRTLAHVELDGIDNVDWEDIAIGPGSVPGRDALYVGDIGDNDADRGKVAIIRFDEPEVDATDGPTKLSVRDAERLKLHYDDGDARDAEALFIDTVTDTLYVVSKAPGDEPSALFSAKLPLRDRDRLHFVGDQRDLPGLDGVVVAADASADGLTIALATRGEALRVWSRDDGESIADVLARPACESDVPRAHTEALALLPSGHGALLVPEGTHPDLDLVPFAASCGTWLPPVIDGRLDDTSDELSGLVASRDHDGVQWVHPDGDDPRPVLFAVDEDGDVLAEVTLLGVSPRDWEDIARLDRSTGPDALVLADTGARLGARTDVELVVFDEPDPDRGDTAVDVERITLPYADGLARDAEAVFVDRDGSLVVVTQPDPGPTTVFVAQAPWASATLRPVVDAADVPELDASIVAADRSRDGALALLTSDDVALVWPASRLPLAERLATAPCRVPMPRGDYESIAWSADGDALWTVREGDDAVRWTTTRF